jgi:hypothetical protein
MRRIFLAGAAGVIGRRLTPLLIAHGHEVWGATRSPDNGAFLRKLGARPMLVDVFEAEALTAAVIQAKPEIVIHQLTDLSAIQDPARRSTALANNARIRDEATRNLVAAARQAGARRLIAQSIAWAYAPGRQPYGEDHPLDTNAEGDRRVSVRASSPSSARSSPHRRWKASCSVMAASTDPEAALMRPRVRRWCMSMRRLMPRCSPSTMASRERSTSRTPMTRQRPTRRAPRLAGAPTFGWTEPEPRWPLGRRRFVSGRSIHFGFSWHWSFRHENPQTRLLDLLGFPWILSSESRLISGLQWIFARVFSSRLFPK